MSDFDLVEYHRTLPRVIGTVHIIEAPKSTYRDHLPSVVTPTSVYGSVFTVITAQRMRSVPVDELLG